MNPRLNLEKTEPEAFKALYALVKYMGTSKLSHTQLTLIEIRASQLNASTYTPAPPGSTAKPSSAFTSSTPGAKPPCLPPRSKRCRP